MSNDEVIMEHQRTASCPPHLRTKLARQLTLKHRRDCPELTEGEIALENTMKELFRLKGWPDPTEPRAPTGRPIDLRWHRRRWLP